MSIKLMIKEHLHTGLKYLCMTRKEDHESYSGSGTYWLDHLNQHGHHFSTEVIFETDDHDLFKEEALRYSNFYNVVDSDEWANLRPEEGDGGDTVSNRMWITDGSQERYIFKTDEIPEGWHRGRYRCVFANTIIQTELSKRVDRKKNGLKIKEAWDKRDQNKFGTRIIGIKGDKNPAKREEVKEKIRQSRLNAPSKECQICGRMTKNLTNHMKVHK
jgi:hypothetical protein